MTGGTPYLATDSARAGTIGSRRSSRTWTSRALIATAARCTPSSTRASCSPAFALLLLEIALRLTRFSRMP